MKKMIKYLMKKIFSLIAIQTLGIYEEKPNVNFYTRFTKNTTLGKNTHFNGLIIRGNGEVTIGDNFHSGKNILLINSYHKYDIGNSIPYDKNEMIDKNIVIEDNVWVGDRVLILGGVVIGEGAIIQAGSVVVSDIAKYGIAGGNPAKIFKYRDIVSFNKLKRDLKFC